MLTNTSKIITLTTDFGHTSPYVAEMKGVILNFAPDATIIDATHAVAPQDILHGAFCLRQFVGAYPDRSVHVAVIDPGVGSDRHILLVEYANQFLVAPDNGLLTFQLESATSIRCVDQPRFWRKEVSATFHGRDIMGPVAAHLAAGVEPAELSSPVQQAPVQLAIPQPREKKNQTSRSAAHEISLEGQVMLVDSYGNLVTNISIDRLATMKDYRIEICGKVVRFHRTYGEGGVGELMSLIGSQGWLEVAVCCGNAAQVLGCRAGEPVSISATKNCE